jgi:undecaprenyl-diphosphatase
MNTLAGLASPWAYLAVGALAMLETAAFVGLAVPGETALVIGGFLAYQGKASLPVMMIVAGAGAIVGDSIGYEIGRKFGPRIRASALGRRVGEERWARGEAYLARRGGRAIFFGRFVGVLRALVPTLAGLSGMPYRRFLAWNAAGGIIWGPSFVLLGYLAGSSYRRIEHIAGRASLVLLLVVVIVGGAVLAARATARQRAEINARLQEFARRPGVARLRTRYQTQLGFAARRFRPGGAYGLSLTVGVVVIIAVGWLFGVVASAVVGHQEFIRVDEPVRRFFLTHEDASVRGFLRALALLGDWRLLLVATGVVTVRLGRRRRAIDGALLALSLLGAIGLSLLVAVVVSRPGPSLQSHSFPSVPLAAITAWCAGAVVIAGARSWLAAVRSVALASGAIALVGVALLALDRSWFSDVVGGFALGALWASAVLVPARTLALLRR